MLAEPEPEAPTRRWCDVQECVRVVDNAYGGECYVASRDISAGEVVLRSPPAALVYDERWRKHSCWNCQRFD